MAVKDLNTYEVVVTNTNKVKVIVKAEGVEEACNKAFDRDGEITSEHDTMNYEVERLVE